MFYVMVQQSSHLDFENRSSRVLFTKKWESHFTKEYSFLQKIGVPAPKHPKWEFRTANQQLVRALAQDDTVTFKLLTTNRTALHFKILLSVLITNS